MRTLGTLTGAGSVLENDKLVCSATYVITVFQLGGTKSASGFLRSDDDLFGKLMNSGELTLQLHDRSTLQFLCSKLTLDGAEIQVSGPVPGF